MEDQTLKGTKNFQRLLVVTAGMIYLLIVVGGIVRVTGSGLGCPDWPTCYGEWLPPMRIDAILEYSHRLVATLTSPLILAAAVIGWRRFREQKWIVVPLYIAGGLLVVQASLGGVVVLMETPPNLVAVHLGTALIILAMILIPWMIVKEKGGDYREKIEWNFTGPSKKLAFESLVLVFVVLISGAIVAGSNSTYGCVGWPLCNGKLIPVSVYGWVHMSHRLIVLLSIVWFVRAWLAVRKEGSANAQRWGHWVFAVFVAQIIIGWLKVTLGFPIWVLGLHVAFASAVWAVHLPFTGFLGLED